MMLVLSRKIDEDILVGNDIVIKVVDIRGDRVQLGITAAPEIPIHRREVYEAIHTHDKSDS
jgi:carbon storage regulator